jgi:hypothetical protein
LPPNIATEKRESNGNGSSNSSNKSSHKETADRIDMPPPPSPASSTCSDTGSITTSHSKFIKLTILMIRKFNSLKYNSIISGYIYIYLFIYLFIRSFH